MKKREIVTLVSLKKKKKVRWSLPVQLFEATLLQLKSIQEYFTWYISSKHFQLCELWMEKQTEIAYKYVQEPGFIVFELAPESDHLEFNQILVNHEIQSKFQLMVTINRPVENHFNCCIYNSKTVDNKFHTKGWVLHDKIENSGKLIQLESLYQLWIQRPFLLFYEKIL